MVVFEPACSRARGMKSGADALDPASGGELQDRRRTPQSVTEFVLKIIPDTSARRAHGRRAAAGAVRGAAVRLLLLTALGARGHRVVHLFDGRSRGL